MLALGRFLQQAAGEADGSQYDSLVEQLVQRVGEAVLVQDRRDALVQLRDVLLGSAKAQLAFGAVGFPVILQVIRDRDDLEMVQLALETLAAAVGSNETGVTQAVAINAQQLARSPDVLPLLLGLLERGPAGLPDFYARYHTLQVLKGLATAAPCQLQEAVLGAPLGLTRLMDLLSEQEVLRNEALLLLTQLAESSPEVQKIAAFEGAFDRLFGIIKEEGGLDGDIVVQDCLALLAALLRGSPPNQLMFRETGFLAQLPALVRLPGGTTSSSAAAAQLPPQKAANLVAALDVVLVLLPPPAADPGAAVPASCAENRQALLQRGLLDVLLGLGLQGGGAPDDFVRAQALLCLAALVTGSRTQQDQLAAVAVQTASGETHPLLLVTLQAAVASASSPEQAAADRLIEAYCSGNPAGQASLAATFTSAPAGNAANSFGGYLLSALGQQGGFAQLESSARAAAAVLHLVAGSSSLKQQLLTLQIGIRSVGTNTSPFRSPAAIPTAQEPLNGADAATATSLMLLCASRLGAVVTQHGRQPGSVTAAINFLRLLLPWLHACPPAVTAFLRAVAQSQPFLVDSIRGSNACSASAASKHPLSRGLLALLLGVCAMHAEDAPGTPSRQQLAAAIDAQIGQQQYLGYIDGLLAHETVAASSATSSGGADSSSRASCSGIFAEVAGVSPAFAAFLGRLAAEVRQRVGVTSAPPPGSGGPPLPAPAQLAQQQSGTLPTPQQQQQHPAMYQSLQQHEYQPPPQPSHAPLLPQQQVTPQLPNGDRQQDTPLPTGFATAGRTPPLQSPLNMSAQPSPRVASPAPSSMSYTERHGWQADLQGAAPPAAMPAAAPLAFAPQNHGAAAPANGAAAGQAQLEEAVMRADAAQRENEQLRAEVAALSERLSLLGSAAGNGPAWHPEAGPHAADLEAASARAVALREELEEARRRAEEARQEAAAAQAAVRKLETDLEDLSAAYSTLDAHADSLQHQVERLQAELAAAQQRQAGGDQQQQQQQQGSSEWTEEDVERRLAQVRQEAQAEADEMMADLLVCLGQEEVKVARLREQLGAYGVDCDALLADIMAAGEGRDEEDIT